MSAFNMPACGETGSVFVDDASRIAVGSVLYAEGVGYLVVTQVKDACEIVVRNDCPSCNTLDPGQPVAEGTLFVVGIPTCVDVGDQTYLGPRLASDYFIPSNGNCVQVAVTSIEGLAIGDTVSINNNRYLIDEIPTTESIVICNEGEGGSAGTLVEADPNDDGIFDYPVLRISVANPCTEDPVDSGSLLVCEGAVQKKLEGSVENQVPAWNQTTGEFELKVISDLAYCVTLTTCLTIDSTNDPCTTYAIDVSPNTTRLALELAAVAPNPLKVEIKGDPFCLTQVVDGNTVRVIPDFTWSGIRYYDEGDPLCVADCCSQCRPTIQTVAKWNDITTCGPDARELLMTTGIEVISAPAGISTHTFPAMLATNDPPLQGFEEEAEHWWKFTYKNANCCDCRKYVEITSNFEVAVFQPADVFTNVELRILKISEPMNTQAFASNHFTSPRGLITAQPYDLIPQIQTINTWKGTVYDRDFVDAGEDSTYGGHIRIVIENTTEIEQEVYVCVNWRVWLKAWDWMCAILDDVEEPESEPV